MSLPFGFIQYIGNNIVPKVTRRERLLSLGRHNLRLHNVAEFCSYLHSRGYGITPATNYTSYELFHDFGFKHVDDIDNCLDETPTILHDLNTPIKFAEPYDLVVDIGTVEHIFNVARAIQTIIEATRVGGYVFHLSPMNWINHGFYNLGPTFFYDVYRVNGFEEGTFNFVTLPYNWDTEKAKICVYKTQFDPNQIVLDVEHLDKLILVSYLARKVEDKPFTIPSQAAYDPVLKLDTLLRVHSRCKA